jgi:16S rRNA U516 pseudouridylate synthase RsuA-like enzyme
VELDDGRTAPAKARRIAPDRFEITIREGRKRQVRRMAEAVGYRVRALERVQLGTLKLGTLAVGTHRRLKVAEVEALRAMAKAPEKAAGRSRRGGRKPGGRTARG